MTREEEFTCACCGRAIRDDESEAWWELVEPRETGWSLNDVRAGEGLSPLDDGDVLIDGGAMTSGDPEDWPVVCPDCLYAPEERAQIADAIVNLPPGAEAEELARRLAQGGEGA